MSPVRGAAVQALVPARMPAVYYVYVDRVRQVSSIRPKMMAAIAGKTDQELWLAATLPAEHPAANEWCRLILDTLTRFGGKK